MEIGKVEMDYGLRHYEFLFSKFQFSDKASGFFRDDIAEGGVARPLALVAEAVFFAKVGDGDNRFAHLFKSRNVENRK